MAEYEGNIRNALIKEQGVALFQFINESISLTALVILAVMSRSLILMTGAVGAVSLLVQAWVVFSISKRLVKNESFDYDYGMGKFESFGGLIANLLMLIGLIAVLCSSAIALFNPAGPSEILVWAIIVKIIGAIINVCLFIRQRKINKIASSMLIDAEDHVIRKNLVFDFIALFTITILYIFREIPVFAYLEPVLCILYSIFMIYKLVHPLKLCAYDLLDKTLDEAIQLKLMKAMAAGNDLYEFFDTIRTRSSGQRIYVDLLIGFNKDKTYEEITESLKKLEELIKSEIPNCVVSIVLSR